METISYERCTYESVDDWSPSWVTFQKSKENKFLVIIRVKETENLEKKNYSMLLSFLFEYRCI